jgi:Family of unknown function (DUF5670)
MLWTIAVILLVLWALGMGSSYTGGGMVHLLLVIAAIVVVFQFMAGRRSVWTGEHVDDSMITTKMKAAIFNDSTLKVDEINVETLKGVVQL